MSELDEFSHANADKEKNMVNARGSQKKGLDTRMGGVFPVISGKNLNKQDITIPDDFSDKNLIIIVAFQRWQQGLVDEAINALETRSVNHSHHIIEVPVIERFSWFRQMRLDAVMRAGITDRNIRQRTITVYLDKDDFREKLQIPNEETIYWFLIGHSSKTILLRGSGIFTGEDIDHIIGVQSS